MTARPTISFGALLKQLRHQQGMTLRGLGSTANIPHSVIAAIESGYRQANIHTAERLADALNVEARSEFILLAISTTKNQRMLPFARQHSSTVLNYLPLCLASIGIEATNIAQTRYGQLPFNGGQGAEDFVQQLTATFKKLTSNPTAAKTSNSELPSLLLRLHDGKVLRISIHVETGR